MMGNTQAAEPKYEAASPPKSSIQYEIDVKKANVSRYTMASGEDTKAKLFELLGGYYSGKGLSERECMLRIAALATRRVEAIDAPVPVVHGC